MKDYTGNKYSHLTMLSYSRPGGKGVGAIWSVRCDCGTVREMKARDVVHGRIRTCGNCEYTRRLRSDPSISKATPRGLRKDLISSCIARAHKEGVDWQLSPDEFNMLSEDICLICGKVPEIQYRRSLERHNYVVRVDHSGPYTLSNCVTMCSRCVSKLAGDNPQEHVDYIETCHSYLIKVLTPTK